MEKGFQLRNYHVRRGKDKDNTPLYPITKAENIIGGAGVTQVTELPAAGDEGKIYYNTTEKKYYIYTEENGWSELGSGGIDGPTYEVKYQYNPCFTVPYPEPFEGDYTDELSLLKVGTKIDTYYGNKLDDNMMLNFNVSGILEANFTVLHLSLEGEFANYLTTLGIDWDTVDRTTISDIKYNTTIKLFDYKYLYGMHGSYYESDWLICKYTVDIEVSPDLDGSFGIKISGIITSTEIINKGTIVCPILHIKYILQPKVLDLTINDEIVRVDACNLSIDTLGLSPGIVNHALDESIHELGTTGFAMYIDDKRPIGSLSIKEYIGDIDSSSIFNVPLFDMLNIVGRFIPLDDNIPIHLPFILRPASGNTDITGGTLYEYHIMNGIFSIIPLLEH